MGGQPPYSGASLRSRRRPCPPCPPGPISVAARGGRAPAGLDEGPLQGLGAGRESAAMTEKKITLSESEIPDHWYNILPDLPEPLGPYLHPVTLEPMGPDDLTPLFPMAL